MAFMKDEHGLTVTYVFSGKSDFLVLTLVRKRQLVYRLGDIWGCKKYGQGHKNPSENSEDVDAYGVKPDVGIEDSGPENADFVQDNDCGYEASDEFTLAPISEIVSCMGDRITQDIQTTKADAIFAVAGSRYAWERYQHGLLINRECSDSLVALCRSAETEKQCQEALGLLNTQIWLPHDHRANLWPLLYVYVLESMNSEMNENNSWSLGGPIVEKLVHAVSSILDGHGKGFLLKQSGSIDLFAFHLLDTINEKYYALVPDMEEQLDDLLCSMHDWVLRTDNRGTATSRAFTTLRQCAGWCCQVLSDVSGTLGQPKGPNIQSSHDKMQKQRKEHHEVYGTLWYKLVMQLLTEEGEGEGVGCGEDRSAGSAEWARNSRRDLGISQSEVLSCLCWVIVSYRENAAHVPGAADMAINGYGHLVDDGGDSPEHFSQRVQGAAYRIANAPSRGLWNEFLTAFKIFNDVIETDGEDGLDADADAGGGDMDARAIEDGCFREEVMTEFVAFVEEALKEFK